MKIDVIKIGNKIVLIQSYIPDEILKKIDAYRTRNGNCFQVNSLDFTAIYSESICLNGSRSIIQMKGYDYLFVSTIYCPQHYEYLKKQCELFNDHYQNIVAS